MILHSKALTKSLQNQEKIGGSIILRVARPPNLKSTTFTKTHLEPLMTEILSVSVLLSTGTIQGFLLRYKTFSYLNWPENGEPSMFEVHKNCLNYDDLCSKTHNLGTLFWTSKLDGSPFPGQMRQERVIYLKRKPYNVPFERRFETGRISVMKGSR